MVSETVRCKKLHLERVEFKIERMEKLEVDQRKTERKVNENGWKTIEGQTKEKKGEKSHGLGFG